MTSYPEKPTSLWWNQNPTPYPSLVSRAEGDVVIIGGGITGITLAWTLAAMDVRVVLVDASWIAGSASGRNAGFLMAGPAEPYSELIAMYGRAGARAVLHTGRRNHERRSCVLCTDSRGIPPAARSPRPRTESGRVPLSHTTGRFLPLSKHLQAGT